MLVKLILTYGISFVDRNDKGRIPLHLAALEGKPQIIDILLTWIPNPDIPDEDNQTPLHLAVYSQNIKSIHLLLLAGANRQFLDFKGITPIDMAYATNRQFIVDIVKNQNIFHQCNPLAHQTKQSKLMFFIGFQIFQVVKYLAFYIFIVPIIPEWASIVSIVIGLCTILMFYKASNSNPGIIHRKKQNLLELYENYKPNFV